MVRFPNREVEHNIQCAVFAGFHGIFSYLMTMVRLRQYGVAADIREITEKGTLLMENKGLPHSLIFLCKLWDLESDMTLGWTMGSNYYGIKITKNFED